MSLLDRLARLRSGRAFAHRTRPWVGWPGSPGRQAGQDQERKVSHASQWKLVYLHLTVTTLKLIENGWIYGESQVAVINEALPAPAQGRGWRRGALHPPPNRCRSLAARGEGGHGRDFPIQRARWQVSDGKQTFPSRPAALGLLASRVLFGGAGVRTIQKWRNWDPRMFPSSLATEATLGSWRRGDTCSQQALACTWVRPKCSRAWCVVTGQSSP